MSQLLHAYCDFVSETVSNFSTWRDQSHISIIRTDQLTISARRYRVKSTTDCRKLIEVYLNGGKCQLVNNYNMWLAMHLIIIKPGWQLSNVILRR